MDVQGDDSTEVPVLNRSAGGLLSLANDGSQRVDSGSAFAKAELSVAEAIGNLHVSVYPVQLANSLPTPSSSESGL